MIARLAVLATAVWCAAHAVWAQEPVGFRHMPLAEAEVERWIAASGKEYQRVSAAEFNALVERLKNHAADPHAAAGTHVSEAVFEARFDKETLVGSAQLRIHHPYDNPSLMPLKPCGLAIRRRDDPPRWLRGEGRPATLGVAEDGSFSVLVEESDELAFDWTLRGRRGASGALEFPLALPACAIRTLRLDLPPGLTPLATYAAVRALEAPAADRRKWEIRLGGGKPSTLTLLDDAAPVPPPEARVRQSLSYHLWPQGLDLTVELTLDVRNTPVRQLEIALDPGLELLAARYRDGRVHWSPRDDKPGSPLVLHFPAPLLGPKHVVTLSAAAPLKFGQRITLPRLRPLGVSRRDNTTEAFWQDGTAQVWTARSLSLDYLATKGCRQSSRATLRALASRDHFLGRQFNVRLFRRDAEIDVLLTRGQTQHVLATGTSVMLGSRETRGRLVAEFSGISGEDFTLTAEIGNGWTVELVESMPRAAMEDWEVVEDAGQRTLAVRLAQPLRPEATLRLTVTGQRLGNPLVAEAAKRPLRFNDLEMLRFSHVRPRRRLMALGTTTSGRLRLLEADHVRLLDARNVEPADARLFEQPAGKMMLELNEPEAEFGLTIDQRQRPLRADIRVEALVRPDALQESYAIRCVPSGAVEELIVRFSHTRGEPLTWSSGSKSDGKTLFICEESDVGETWRVRFPEPRNSPFELRAVRTVAKAKREEISLPYLPAAGRQTGWIGIRAASHVALEVENSGFTAVPATATRGQPAPLRGAYRFDPQTAQAGTLAIVRGGHATASAGALATQVHLDSFYEPSGRTRHVARIALENTDLESVVLSLPPNSQQIDAYVDQVRVARHEHRIDRLSVPLPAASHRFELRVQFTIVGRGLGFSTAVQAPLPELQNIPMAAGEWTIWLPASYQAVSLSDAWPGEATPSPSLSRRLLGPFAQGVSSGPSRLMAAPTTSGDATSGWKAHRFSGSTNVVPEVEIVYRRSLETLGWAVLPLAALAVWYLGRRGGRWLLGSVVVVTAVALLVPAIYVPVTSRAMLGMLAGCLALFLLRGQGAEGTGEHRTKVLGSSIIRAGVLLLTVSGVSAWAGSPEPDEKSDLPVVIVPADADGNTAGAKEYFVPMAVWARWQQQVAAIRGEPRGWLLERADYTARWVPPVPPAEPAVAELTAAFHLRVFGDAEEVKIAFPSPVPAPRPRQGVLDGRVVPITWDETGRALHFPVAKAGSYALEIKFRPAIRNDGAGWRFDQPVPPLASAVLSVALPEQDEGTAALPSVVGEVRRSPNGRVLHAQLGPARRIDFRWDKTPGGEPPMVEADQLLWLDVRPGSVSLKVKLLYQVPRGNVRRVRLALDRGLRLRGAVQLADGTPLKTESEGPGELSLWLDRPRTGKIAIEAEFLLDETPGFGVLRLPRIEVLDVPRVRRSLAVSLDPRLQFEEQGMGETPRMGAADFLKLWGETPDAPRFVRSLPDATHPWSIRTFSRPPERSVRQTLRVSVDTRRADLRYEADIAMPAGTCFQHRLRVPPTLEVDRLEITSDGKPIPVRWSKPIAGEVTVFLPDPSDEESRLTLLGHLPIPASGIWNPPSIQVDAAQTVASTTRIYRRRAVRVVAVPRAAKLFELAEEAPRWLSDAGRLVGQFSAPATGAAKMTLRLLPNRPQAIAPLCVTALRQEGELWHVEAIVDLRVAKGVLDEVGFDLPSGVTETPVAMPAGSVERLTDLGFGRTLWRYVPGQALAGGRRLRITFPLHRQPSQPPVAPDVRPLLVNVRRFLALPSPGESPSANWQLEGLTPVALPPGEKAGKLATRLANVLEGLEGISGEYRAYRIDADKPFRAVLKPTDTVAGKPRVVLADIEMHCLPDGSCHGRVRFELDPGGRRSCELEVPPGFNVPRVTVEGSPAIVTTPGRDRRKITLVSAHLPQQIEVVFTGSLGQALEGECHLPVPTLVDVPVADALWNVIRPRDYLASVSTRSTRSTAAGGQRLRLRVASDAILSSAEHLSPEAIASWYEPRLAQLLRGLAHAQQHKPHEHEELVSIKKSQKELAEKLGATAVFERLEELAQAYSEANQQRRLPGTRGASEPFLPAQPSASVAVNFTPPDRDGFASRGVALLALLLLGTAAFRTPALGDFCRRWPHWLGVLIGFAWWLWLWPSFIGWLIIGLSLLLSLWPVSRVR